MIWKRLTWQNAFQFRDSVENSRCLNLLIFRVLPSWCCYPRESCMPHACGDRVQAEGGWVECQTGQATRHPWAYQKAPNFRGKGLLWYLLHCLPLARSSPWEAWFPWKCVGCRESTGRVGDPLAKSYLARVPPCAFPQLPPCLWILLASIQVSKGTCKCLKPAG